MHRPIRKAIFPVGGLGTRFLPATKALPKEMLPVVDKPIIQYAVEEAWAAGIRECIFVTGRGKTAIEDHFDFSYELQDTLLKRGKQALWETITKGIPQPGEVAYIRQQEALGLGHAVWCARNLIGDEPFAVLLADDLVLAERPCLVQMMEAYNKVGGNLVAITEVAPEQTSLYGIIRPTRQQGNLIEADAIVEKPTPRLAPSNKAVIGRYILQPSIFKHLAEKHTGAGGEIQLTDALDKIIREETFHGVQFEGQRFDCGNNLGFLEANIAFALARPGLKEGVRGFLGKYTSSCT
ncbi:MAG: UTP--glucose-1-phosphate uridylyltransferase GalU [Holosporales bacterium]